MAFLLSFRLKLAEEFFILSNQVPDVISKTGCHPERIPARRDEPKDLHLFFAFFNPHQMGCPGSLAFGDPGNRTRFLRAHAHSRPIHETSSRAHRIRNSRRRLLRWRRRENLTSAHWYRFRFRLRSLLRFFSAFIFASHAASMTQPPAPEKSRKGFPRTPSSSRASKPATRA